MLLECYFVQEIRLGLKNELLTGLKLIYLKRKIRTYSTLQSIIRVRKYRPLHIIAHVISSDNSRWEKFRNVGVNLSVQARLQLWNH